MKVRATGRAKREIARAALWWSKNRPHAPHLFLDELEAAERHFGTAPISGQIYGYRKNRLIRRWLLEQTEYHVYFSVNRNADVVMLYACMHVRSKKTRYYVDRGGFRGRKGTLRVRGLGRAPASGRPAARE